MPNQSNTHSNDTKTLVTVLLLIFVYPIGLIVMYVWTHWPTWVKVVVSLPLILGIVGMVFALAIGGLAIDKSKTNKTYYPSPTIESVDDTSTTTTTPSLKAQKDQCLSDCRKTSSSEASCTQLCSNTMDYNNN